MKCRKQSLGHTSTSSSTATRTRTVVEAVTTTTATRKTWPVFSFFPPSLTLIARLVPVLGWWWWWQEQEVHRLCLSVFSNSRFVLTDHIRFRSSHFSPFSVQVKQCRWWAHWILSNRWGTESNGASDQPPELGWLLLFFRFRMIVCACNNDVWLCSSLASHLHKWHGFPSLIPAETAHIHTHRCNYFDDHFV